MDRCRLHPLSALFLLHRKLRPGGPLVPRPDVVAHLRQAGQLQRVVSARGTRAAMAVRDDFRFQVDAALAQQSPNRLRGPETTAIQKPGPLDPYRSRYRAAPRAAWGLVAAGMLVDVPHV